MKSLSFIPFPAFVIAAAMLWSCTETSAATPKKTCMYPGEVATVLANGQIWCDQPAAKAKKRFAKRAKRTAAKR